MNGRVLKTIDLDKLFLKVLFKSEKIVEFHWSYFVRPKIVLKNKSLLSFIKMILKFPIFI